MITCSYRGNEFVRVGFWLSNALMQDEDDARGAYADGSAIQLRCIILRPDELIGFICAS